MKIIRLQSSNIMRLVAVDVTPKGDLVIIGGPNGAGKSSVLNSIAMALGGLALAPAEPIRVGESEARIVVDLDDLKVIRRFSRESIHSADCSVNAKPGGAVEAVTGRVCDCTPSWSETRSTLAVTSTDGLAQYKSPQAMLDKLLGKLTFDPLAFATADPKWQDATLRSLVGIDTKKIDEVRAEAFAERARIKKHHEAKAAVVASMPFHEGMPDTEIPLAEISAEMQRAEELRKLAAKADQDVINRRNSVTGLNENRAALAARIGETHRRIEELNSLLTDLDSQQAQVDIKIEAANAEIAAAELVAQAARQAVPDAAGIRARLADVEAANARVRANAARSEAQAGAEALKAAADEQHEIVIAADEEKRRLLANAQFPVQGLGIGEDGVTFGGVPFAQAASNEQLRVSIAIGIALNPKLKVLLIRNGNMLDEDSLAAIAKQAEEAGAQLWIEWVTKDAEDATVMIEEGRVVGETV